MEYSSILSLALLSGIIGLGVYCASCAMHVWNRRNAGSGPRVPGRFARGVAAGLVVTGVTIMLVAVIVRAAINREGRLRGEGLFTVRAPEKLQVEWIATATEVRTGDVLARFHSPEREAEIAALTLKKQILEAEKRMAQNEALELDGEVVRRQQEIASERRHLQASRDLLVPARDMVERERMRDVLSRKEQIRRLDAELDRARAEMKQAVARRDLADRQLVRVKRLAENSVASVDEHDKIQTEAVISRAEIQKTESQIAHLESQKSLLERDVAQMDDTVTAQSDLMAGDVNRVREKLASLETEWEPLRRQLDADLARAQAVREARLTQLDLEIQQASATLAGFSQALAITAPFAGRVIYRNPSPRTAHDSEPLCVLMPADGLRLQVRLPASEARSLRRAGPIVLKLEEGLERRFAGELAGWRELPHDPGHVLGDIVCEAPAEAVRELAAGDTVMARLLWLPPLYTIGFCQLGAVLVVAGVLGWAALVRSGRRQTVSDADVPAAEASHADPAPLVAMAGDRNGVASAMLESGAAGSVLTSLGCRLREAIRTRTVTPELLGAIEWNLDRHHARAIQHLSASFAHDGGGLNDDLERLRNGNGNGNGHLPDHLMERLDRILRAIAPDRLQWPARPSCRRPDDLPKGYVNMELVRDWAGRAVGSSAGLRPRGHDEELAS